MTSSPAEPRRPRFCLILKAGEQARSHRDRGWNRGLVGGNTDARQHKGEPRLPFNFVVARAFFIIEGRSFLFMETVSPFPLFLWIPIRDQKQTYFFER